MHKLLLLPVGFEPATFRMQGGPASQTRHQGVGAECAIFVCRPQFYHSLQPYSNALHRRQKDLSHLI